MINGKIIKGIGGFYYVDTEKGLYECRARGIFRKNKITPLVGDRVSISVVDKENKKGVVEEIEKRDTELVRPPIANVDKALIVFAIKNPAPNLSLLDRFIVLAEKENLEIVIVFTKVDLDADGELLEELKSIYEVSGYKVIPVSNKLKLNIDKIKRGKHTTRHAELLKLECGGMVADTPGFSSLTLDDIDESELKEYFIEFDKYDDCRFGSRCIHENEPSCAVKEAVENGEISKKRYESYIQLLNEIRSGKRRY